MNYPTASPTWGEEEINAVVDVVRSGHYTMGEKTKIFEQMYADYIGTKYCVACNSGSSANLLMVAAFSLRYGVGEVLVPAVGWSTSYSPFQQYGWKLKFIDIDRKTLNFDTDQLTDAHEDDFNILEDGYGQLILAINLLGNPNEFREFPSMIMLEDNCESMGAEYANRKTGSFGMMASHSTYFAHHMCTMEGGLITTDDEYFYQMLLSLRSHGWTRHLPKNNLLDAEVAPFEFIYPGFNVRPIEVQSAVGIEQLKKLPMFVKNRMDNLKSFKEVCKKKGWGFQEEPEWGRNSSFGCALFSGDIEDIKRLFKEKGIDYRPIMSHFTQSPAIKYYDYSIFGSLDNADWVQKNGIFIGNHHYPVDWGFLD